MKAKPAKSTADVLPGGVDPFSDLGNAHRLVREHGANLRHAPGLGWLDWNEIIWQRDEGAAYRRAMDASERLRLVAIERLRVAASKEEQDEADRLLAHARRSQQEPQIRRAMELAKHLPPIATAADAFDRNPMLFACANGTIDLRTGELLEARREDHITRSSPVEYDAGAMCPTFTAMIERSTPDVLERGFRQRAYGYSMTGETGEQKFFVVLGNGGEGKTTELEAVRYVFGDYAMHVSTDTLMQSKMPRGAENDVARMRGAHLATATESAKGRRLDEERIKRLTGGDKITARYLYKEPFEFHAICKLWLVTNDLPRIDGGDAIWRRIYLIRFGVKVREPDQDLPAKLRAEAPGILAWCVRGCRDWLANGLMPPESVTANASGWREDENPLGDWIADRCERAECMTSRGPLYSSYVEHARAAGDEPVTLRKFADRLVASGYPRRKSGSRRGFYGIALRGAPRQTEAMLS